MTPVRLRLPDFIPRGAGRGRFVALLTLAAAVLIVVAAVVGRAGGDGSGTVADWVAALATVAAFIAAVIAARYAAQAVRREAQRDQRREDDRRRAQADMVAVWVAGIEWIGKVEWTFPGTAPSTEHHETVLPEHISLTVWNRSILPVWNLRLHLYLLFAPDPAPVYVATYEAGFVLPGEHHFDAAAPAVVKAFAEKLSDRPEARQGPSQIAFGWSMTDNASVTWLREPRGLLLEVPAGSVPAALAHHNPDDAL